MSTNPESPKTPRSGRYRYQGNRPLNPNEGVHPEMVDMEANASAGAGIPNSPEELIAMQENKPEHPEKPERGHTPKVKQVLDLLHSLDTTAYEDLQVALAVVRHLEKFHDEVVEEMQNDEDAKHSQIVCWAIDADRLYRSRLLLESVNLE